MIFGNAFVNAAAHIYHECVIMILYVLPVFVFLDVLFSQPPTDPAPPWK